MDSLGNCLAEINAGKISLRQYGVLNQKTLDYFELLQQKILRTSDDLHNVLTVSQIEASLKIEQFERDAMPLIKAGHEFFKSVTQNIKDQISNPNRVLNEDSKQKYQQ